MPRADVDAYACRLIARIQRDRFDTEAVLALAVHYEAQGDLPSLANLMEGWAQTLREPGTAAGAYIAAGDAALAASGDRARARRLYQRALERSPKHALARARLGALAGAGRSNPPPPPPRAISEIRSVDGDAVWLDDEHLELLDDTPRRYEETQRIWRPQAR